MRSMGKRLQLVGPCSDFPDYNCHMFNHVASELRKSGFIVFNPAQSFLALRQMLGREPTWNECMKETLQNLVFQDGIVLLPNAQLSEGSIREYLMADAMGLEVHDWSKLESHLDKINIKERHG